MAARPPDRVTKAGNDDGTAAPGGGVSVSATGAFTVEAELRSLRALLEQQVAALAWNDFTRRAPLKARALTDLARLGLDAELALEILADLPAELSNEQSQRMPYALLARRIQVCPPPAQVRGALALIGPPGGGKSTTLAKLAARGDIDPDERVVLVITGEGLKTLDAVRGTFETQTIAPTVEAFEVGVAGRVAV